ncbi:MAG: 16S rRNA processing protein RimM [Flavobacteriales bacterium TMED191]|nr:MAG: 16S rRNA processing protein RimM [Flavobacteriales bacterium TMED191]
MNQTNKILIGHVAKCHGLHGLFSIKLNTPIDLFQLFINTQIIYIENNINPMCIQSIQLNSKVFIKVKTKEITNRENAKDLLRKNIYIKIGDHPIIDEAFNKKNQLINYKMFDKTQGLIGEIVEINHNSPQPLFIVKRDDKSIPIPFVEEIIMEINENNNIINVDLPEGLIEICSE